MKHIKLYEELNDEPKVGDYVVCSTFNMIHPDYFKFILSNIGEVVEIEAVEHKMRFFTSIKNSFKIEYRNMPATSWSSFKEYWYRWCPR